MSEHDRAWEIYIGYGDSLGGRALRRQMVRELGSYRLWTPREDGPEEPAAASVRWQGLLLPFLEIGAADQEKLLPRVALSLQKAREFSRVVVLLREPLPEVLDLIRRHQEKGLNVTTVCARAGAIYGGEGPEDAFGPMEELVDALRERLASSSPRKRLSLPYGEGEQVPLTYVGELASAAIFVLRRDEETAPLLVEGASWPYGELASFTARAAGFQGKLQFGKGKLPKAQDLPQGFRRLQGRSLYPPGAVLPYLLKARARGGQLRLSACVIMRDNQEDIGRCLASLAAADELIVVDTGSVDKSVEIAQQYTDKIFHFHWINDFAAAKNYALAQATGDWIVFPDSDEFFTEETAGNLHQLAEDYDGPWGQPAALSVRHANVTLSLEPMGQEGAVIRLWQAGLAYEGAVHEHLEYQGDKAGFLLLDVPRERLLMLHTGYAPERMAEKTKRNLQILERERQEGKDPDLYHYYKARGLFATGDFQGAREEILQQYHAPLQPVSLRAEIYRLWYRSSQMLKDKEAMEEARAAMEKDMPQLPDAWALKGVALWNEGREEEAAPLLQKALELSAKFLAENPREIDQVSEDMPAIARELAEFYQKRGDMEAAEKIKKTLT